MANNYKDIFNPPYDIALVAAAQAGNRQAQTELFLIFQPMIKAIAKKKSLAFPEEREDLFSYLSLQFLLCLQKYKPEKSTEFHHYIATNLAYQGIKMYKKQMLLRQREALAPQEELPEYLQEEEGYQQLYADTTVANIIKYLSPEEKILVRDRYVHKMTLRAMGAKYGVSHVAVEKRMVKLLNKIHAELEAANFIF